jgi:hypothetical protein
MGVGPMSPDGHVASGMNVWTLLSTICCVCACISTLFYLRVREKYLQRENEAYARRLRENEENDVGDAASSDRGKHPVAKERRDGLEKMLREMQTEVRSAHEHIKSRALPSCCLASQGLESIGARLSHMGVRRPGS